MELALSNHASGELKALAETVSHLESAVAAQLLAATADVTLILDSNSVIESVTIGEAEPAGQKYAAWIGQAWVDTVTIESRPKIEAIMQTALEAGPPKWRQVNHPSPEGVDLPVRYFAVKAGQGDKVVAVGRDLRAAAQMQQRLLDTQYAMEREFARLRKLETRYRLLFQVSAEAVLIVNTRTHKVVESNPAAAEIFDATPRQLVGKPFPDMFAPDFQETVQTVMAGGRVEGLRVRLEDGNRQCLLSASVFRQDGVPFLLARLILEDEATPERLSRTGARCLEVIENLPEGFVVADSKLNILSANSAFLEMAQLATSDQAHGQPLSSFIGRTQVDLNVLVSNVRQHGSVRQFKTVMRDSYGSSLDTEISAVYTPGGDLPCFGFTIRALNLDTQATPIPGDLPRSVEQLTKLVGRVSLKEIVRDTTDLIERLCIEAALELTQENRASAAEMLGLSRQGLYAKLRRYNIVE